MGASRASEARSWPSRGILCANRLVPTLRSQGRVRVLRAAGACRRRALHAHPIEAAGLGAFGRRSAWALAWDRLQACRAFQPRRLRLRFFGPVALRALAVSAVRSVALCGRRVFLFVRRSFGLLVSGCRIAFEALWTRQTHLPTVGQIFLDAFGRRLGIAPAPTHDRSRKPMERKRHLRSLCHRDNAIKHERAVDYEGAFAGKQ